MSKDTKLNSQGMSRSFEPLMSSIVSRSNKIFISVDLSAGEPSVTSHYSQDRQYTYCNFTGVGKKPFYKNKILMIDDMYIMGASVSPTGRKSIFDAYHSTWRGNSFADQWIIDKKVITKDSNMSSVRYVHKKQILAMQYGQSPDGMVKKARDDGIKLSNHDAKLFHKAFWYDLFPDVRRLGERLKIINKKQGYLVNEFGFRMFPEIRKSLNYWIQSSVSGVVDLLMISFYNLAPYANHLAIIHDELIFEVPDDKLQDAKKAMDMALDHVNRTLNWSIKIRTGWVEGRNFFAAH